MTGTSSQGFFDVTDEPGQQIPFMYHYANRPGLSTRRSRDTLTTFFNLEVDGLPGNDGISYSAYAPYNHLIIFVEDSGAMGSYAFFYLAGMYPVPATRQYLLSSPFFPSISFTNPVFNTVTTIRATNFDGNDGDNVFVKARFFATALMT